MAISAVAERAMRVGLELTSLVGDGSGFVSFQCRRALKISPGIRSPKWKEAAERVVAAQMARDGTKPGTPEREAADREGAKRNVPGACSKRR